MGFPRQEYWTRLPFPSPGDLPDPGIEPTSPALQGDSLLSEPGSEGVEAANWGCSGKTAKCSSNHCCVQVIQLQVLLRI